MSAASDPEYSVDEFLGGLNRNQLHCRTTGHQWVIRTKEAVSGSIYLIVEVCRSCLTEAEITFDVNHRVVLNRKYTYSTGYLSKNVSGHITRGDAMFTLLMGGKDE